MQLPTASLMLDDGTVERRVRLIRPTDELRFGLDALAETHWQPADRETFATLWDAEVATGSGILDEQLPHRHRPAAADLAAAARRQLPRLPLQTDDGERIIGRLIAPALVGDHVPQSRARPCPFLSADEAWSGLIDGRIGVAARRRADRCAASGS